MTIRNPFKNSDMRKMFDAVVNAFEVRHKDLFARDGQPHRMNGVASPFWRGYFGERNKLFEKSSPSYAAFRAGEACRKYNIEFERDGKTVFIGSNEVTEQRRGGPGRGQGRKPIDHADPTVTVSVRLTTSQRARLHELGGAEWVRRMLDESEPRR